jgi:uncharacterized protein involved in exopolysaccharide biosynthesis
MNIAHFFRILWVRRNLILVTTLAALAAAVLIIKLVPARYTATSRVMLEIVKPDPVTGQVMSSQFARAFVATQIELIKDYKVAGRVVDQFQWTSSPVLAAAYQASGEGPKVDFRRWAAQRVIDGTTADLIPGSNILELSYTSDNPDTSAKIADALRDAYLAETRMLKQASAQKSADWFSNQTRKLRGELTAAEKKKAEYERENGVVINPDLTDSESTRLAAMSGLQDAPAMPAMSIGMPVSSPSQAQLAQIDAGIQNAMRTLGPNHPTIVALRQQRAVVAAQASQELAAARAAARPVGGSVGPSAADRIAAQRAKVLAQRGQVSEAQQLAIDVAVLREQVQNAAKRTAELQQEAESDETGLSFLGSAVAPSSPSFPKIPLLVVGAIVLGISLGAGLSILVELLFRKVRGPADLEIAGVPLLGMANVAVLTPTKPSLMQRAQRLIPLQRASE